MEFLMKSQLIKLSLIPLVPLALFSGNAFAGNTGGIITRNIDIPVFPPQKHEALVKRHNALENRVDRGLAQQAALAGLFQPYNIKHFNVTAAVGGYGPKHAIAVGTGYRFNEKFAAKVGIALSERNSAAYNAAVDFEW